MKDNQMKQAEDKERELFEAHMIKTCGKGINLNRDTEWVDENTTTGLIYLSENVESAWHGWQARAKLTTSQVSEPVGWISNRYTRHLSESAATDLRAYDRGNDVPVYLHPTSTPQEAISPAIAEYIKRLEEGVQVLIKSHIETCGQLQIDSEPIAESYKNLIDSKPTGLE
jgi:hypothetical protein